MPHLHSRWHALILTCIISSALSTAVAAAPSSDDILAMCERALQNGYRGRAAQMCTWYVTPCDCDAPNGEAPRVCIPDHIPSSTLAEQIVSLLKGLPEFRQADGATAVASLLAVRYPCGM